MRNRYGLLFSLLLFLWAFFVLLAYCNSFLLHQSMEDFVLDDLLICVFLSGVSILAGNFLLDIFRLPPRPLLEDALFSLALGYGFVSLAVFLLATLGILYPATIIVLLLALTVLALCNHRFARHAQQAIKNWKPRLSATETVLISLIGLFVALTLLNTLTPPVSRDALIHHLAIPKLYLKNHGLVNVPFSDSSYYPPLLEMLFTVGMGVASDIAAKLIHFSFYLATILFTFVVGKDYLPRPFCLSAACLFGSLPVVFQVSSLAYVDLGLAFYTMAGLAAFLRWYTSGDSRWFSLSAILTGLAVGCKYNGLIVLAVMLVMITFVLARKRVSLKELAGKFLLFLLVAISVNTLWMGRNVAYTANPLYPQGRSFIGTSTSSNIGGASQYHLRSVFYGETLWDQIILPWNLSTKIKSKANYELDGVINPIFLIVLPGLFLVSRKQPGLRWLGYFCLLYFLFFWASSRVRLRYLMPIYPMLSILTAYVLANWNLKGKKVLALTILFVAFHLNLYWLVVYINSTNPFDFLTGKTSRPAFLREHIPSYPVFEYANANLSSNSRILFLYGGKFGNDGYYLNHDYVYQSRDLGYPLRKILAASCKPEDVHREFLEQGITHLLINWKLLQFDLNASLGEREHVLFKKYSQDFLSLECAHGGNVLYSLF